MMIETNSRKIIKHLEQDGYMLVSVRGSHHKFDKRRQDNYSPASEKRHANWHSAGNCKNGRMAMTNRTTYLALVHKDKGSAWGLTFPDLPGCFLSDR